MKNRNAPHTGPIAPLVVGALLGSAPCALSLHSDTSVYSLSQIIREARTLADNARQVSCRILLSAINCLPVLLTFGLGRSDVYFLHRLPNVVSVDVPVVLLFVGAAYIFGVSDYVGYVGFDAHGFFDVFGYAACGGRYDAYARYGFLFLCGRVGGWRMG